MGLPIMSITRRQRVIDISVGTLAGRDQPVAATHQSDGVEVGPDGGRAQTSRWRVSAIAS